MGKILSINKLTVLILLFIIVFSGVIWLIVTIHDIKIQKRLSKHAIITNNNSLSILDSILKKYNDWKQKIITNIKKEDKSIKNTNSSLSSLIDQIILAFIFFIGYYLISILLYKPNILIAIAFLIIGFMSPSFLDIIKEHQRKKEIERDLLKVITLINNSLQSGKSILEAIDKVCEELDGEIKNEFILIRNDINHGISLHDSFKRFEKRVNIEEISYITSSISLLNKTGGNMIKVFSNLEKRFYIRRKLNQELSSTVASSKLMFYILSILPIIILIGISFIDTNYFILFFNNDLGRLLGIIILTIYIIYVMVIRNIMKIDKY